MKILIQNSIFYPHVIGGAEISTHLLGRELRSRGVEADAVASTGLHGSGTRFATRPTSDGLGTVYEADAHGYCDLLTTADPQAQPGVLMRGLNHFAAVSSSRWEKLFVEVLDRSRPDVVHTNTIVGLTPSIWEAARLRGIPVVHTVRDYHLMCPRTTLLRSDGTDCRNPPLPCRILAGLKRRHTGGLQVVTGMTRYVLQRHLEAGFFPGARTEIVPNALEEWPAEIPDRGTGTVRGMYLGQMAPNKGIAPLLEALEEIFADSQCAGFGFDFAGAGRLSEVVREFCDRHPDRARYHGMISGQAKRELLQWSSFMVVPSVWAEPFSRSIIEGFSWGLPAIGSDRGGIPEVITDGADGLVVTPEPAALGRAVRALACDHELRRRLGVGARARAADFTLTGEVDRFLAIYRDLVQDGGSHDDQS